MRRLSNDSRFGGIKHSEIDRQGSGYGSDELLETEPVSMGSVY